MGALTGNGMHDSARELTEMASTQFAFYGLMNTYTYQRPKITPLPNETGLTVPGGTGVAVVPNGTAPALNPPYLPGQYTKYPAAVQGLAQQALPGWGSGIESGSGTGTVWDNITPTQENYPYTNIPKSFEIEVNGEKMWVHGNATEHMYEDVYKGITTGNGTAYTNPNLYTQEIMSDFCGSLQEATKSGIVYGEKITQGNWEFIFAQPRQAGQLPVIKHAQFNGWH